MGGSGGVYDEEWDMDVNAGKGIDECSKGLRGGL